MALCFLNPPVTHRLSVSSILNLPSSLSLDPVRSLPFGPSSLSLQSPLYTSLIFSLALFVISFHPLPPSDPLSPSMILFFLFHYPPLFLSRSLLSSPPLPPLPVAFPSLFFSALSSVVQPAPALLSPVRSSGGSSPRALPLSLEFLIVRNGHLSPAFSSYAFIPSPRPDTKKFSYPLPLAHSPPLLSFYHLSNVLSALYPCSTISLSLHPASPTLPPFLRQSPFLSSLPLPLSHVVTVLYLFSTFLFFLFSFCNPTPRLQDSIPIFLFELFLYSCLSSVSYSFLLSHRIRIM